MGCSNSKQEKKAGDLYWKAQYEALELDHERLNAQINEENLKQLENFSKSDCCTKNLEQTNLLRFKVI